MLSAVLTNKFEKDLKLMRKRGKDLRKLRIVMDCLLQEEKLPRKYLEHNLCGNYINCRECHIEPDWLLIYCTGAEEVTFYRTGTHSDLF